MKDLEEHGQNLGFLFLMYCLTLWSPGACVHLSDNMVKPIPSPPLAHQLKKRNANFLQYGFAVCEIPFYKVCRPNVTRIACSELGCCYHKEVCYKKAMPQYMRAFIGLIFIVFAMFSLYMLQSCIVGRKPKRSAIKETIQPLEIEESSSGPSESSSE
ncbi:testis-expressed protein 29 [Anolis carolinensis]|uniref:testis-expressed protein 29 n=1 Tax=Anolis carolinensis TaxID=28377 RepID=UPI002F2B5A0B